MSEDLSFPAATGEAPRALPWRRRNPRLARALLYGGLGLLLAGGALWRHRELETTRQEGLMTRVTAAQQMYVADPDGILRFLRAEVLEQRPAPDVRRQAQMTVAACYVASSRWDEAERAYAEAAAGWPSDLPRGTLTIPWACMRVDAGKPGEALALMDAPDATSGWDPATQVEEIRARAKAALLAPRAATADAR